MGARFLFTVFVSGTLVGLANTPPAVSNVTASQRSGTKLVDIYYDAVDAENDKLIVRLWISHDGGSNYLVRANSIIGDVGVDVSAGIGKHIVWDAGVDWDGEFSEKMRVKIAAIDRNGQPGMEFGDESVAGGFIFGDDTAKCKHVSIPWSYWMGKYEVMVDQYCEFLRWAKFAGYVDSSYCVLSSAPFAAVCPAGTSIKPSGQYTFSCGEIVPASGCTNNPVIVNWYGAMAFCRFYGYDLPTEAEWEKAVRGPSHDGLGEHLTFPWGDTSTGIRVFDNGSYRCKSGQEYEFNSSGFNASEFEVMSTGEPCNNVNELGMYDISHEWTRTSWIEDYDDYLPVESLTNGASVIGGSTVTVRYGNSGRGGVSKDKWHAGTIAVNNSLHAIGFRACRRQSGVNDFAAAETGSGTVTSDLFSTGVETFEGWSARSHNQYGYIISNGYTWGLGYMWECVSDSQWAYSGSKSLYRHNSGGGTGDDSFGDLILPVTSGNLVEVRMKVGNFDGNLGRVYLYSSVTGNSYSNVSKEIPAASGYTAITITPSISGKYNYITTFGAVYIDDIELIFKNSN